MGAHVNTIMSERRTGENSSFDSSGNGKKKSNSEYALQVELMHRVYIVKKRTVMTDAGFGLREKSGKTDRRAVRGESGREVKRPLPDV